MVGHPDFRFWPKELTASDGVPKESAVTDSTPGGLGCTK